MFPYCKPIDKNVKRLSGGGFQRISIARELLKGGANQNACFS